MEQVPTGYQTGQNVPDSATPGSVGQQLQQQGAQKADSSGLEERPEQYNGEVAGSNPAPPTSTINRCDLYAAPVKWPGSEAGPEQNPGNNF